MSEKEENRYRILAIITLIISIISLSIAYLAMSRMIKIKSDASNPGGIIKDEDVKINDYRWNIYFTNLKTAKYGDAKIDKYPVLNSNKSYIGNFEITLTKPGDRVVFYYDIVNNGNLDAKYDKTYINGIYDTSNNEEKIIKSIYSEADLDGDGVTTYDEIKKASQNIKLIDNGYKGIIGKNEKKTASIEIAFSGDEVPKGMVRLGINIRYNYIQK